MGTRRLVRPLVAVAALLATGLVAAPANAEPSNPRAVTSYLESTVARMTLEEKVGQLFSTRVYGRTADSRRSENMEAYGVATPREVVQKYHLGGVLYFAWTDSVEHPVQTAGLSNGLQRAALSSGAHIPLQIQIDQEGGIVARVGPPVTQFPGNMALGAGRSTDDARDAAAITGKELAAMGIRQNFAPVADVNVNPRNPVIGVRSFSSDPQLTARLTAAQVSGYEQDAGISAANKHFPGHGDTATDSHYGFPIIKHTKEEWRQLDAPPFEASIERGIDSIMTAHIQMPAFDDSGDPATLSEPIMTDLLREQLGYDGVVVTDSLGMAGVRQKYGDDRVPVLALKAGVDVLLNPPEMDVAYNAVLDAVEDGELTEKRIDESLYRILRMKWFNGQIMHPFVDGSKVMDVVGTPEHLERAQEITDRTTTVVKNGHLPLSAEARDVLVTGWGSTSKETLAAKLQERDATTEVHDTGTSPTDAEIDTAVAEAEQNDLTVVTTMKAWDTDETNDTNPTDPEGKQQQLVKALLETGKPVVVVSVRDPYDIAYFDQADTYLATYSYTEPAMESLARVLYGEVSPKGELPVSIPTADDPSQVLYPFGHGLSW